MLGACLFLPGAPARAPPPCRAGTRQAPGSCQPRCPAAPPAPQPPHSHTPCHTPCAHATFAPPSLSMLCAGVQSVAGLEQLQQSFFNVARLFAAQLRCDKHISSSGRACRRQHCQSGRASHQCHPCLAGNRPTHAVHICGDVGLETFYCSDLDWVFFVIHSKACKLR